MGPYGPLSFVHGALDCVPVRFKACTETVCPRVLLCLVRLHERRPQIVGFVPLERPRSTYRIVPPYAERFPVEERPVDSVPPRAIAECACPWHSFTCPEDNAHWHDGTALRVLECPQTPPR
jgi:hypothetical protein